MYGDQSIMGDVDPNLFLSSKQREADKNLLVKFFIKPRLDKEKTAKEGRPIYKDVEHVDIKIPGNRNSGSCHPVSQQDINRFPDHYKAFKDRVNMDFMEGTPLSEWPLISRSMAEELSFFHVKTVEQLATMADGQASKFMGLSGIRAKAKTWLAAAEKEKPLWEMDQKILAQNAEIAELKQALSDVLNRVEGGSIDGENTAQAKRQSKRAVTKAKEMVE